MARFQGGRIHERISHRGAKFTERFKRLIAEGAAVLFGAKTMSLTALDEDSDDRLKPNHFVMPLVDVARIKKDPNVGITLFTFLALRAPHLLDPADLAAFNNPEAPVRRRTFIPRAPALANEEPSTDSVPPWRASGAAPSSSSADEWVTEPRWKQSRWSDTRDKQPRWERDNWGSGQW